MKVKFNIVRIGRRRKNPKNEAILKENIVLLKQYIRYFLECEKPSEKNNDIHLDIAIPTKGLQSKIVLNSIKEESLKLKIKEKFSNIIYKGEYDILLDNIDNQVWH